MCEARHTRNDSLHTSHDNRLNIGATCPRSSVRLRLLRRTTPTSRPPISAALMRQVARGEVAPTIRLNRTGPILAFGKLDRLRPGYRRAVAIAREAGYVPVERIAGGRAAVFHEGTISFSHAIRAAGGSGSYAGTQGALRRDGGDDRRGDGGRSAPTPGSARCPASTARASSASTPAARTKLAGIGQRVIVGGAHVGAVIVVRGAGRINEVLGPDLRGARARLGPGGHRHARRRARRGRLHRPADRSRPPDRGDDRGAASGAGEGVRAPRRGARRVDPEAGGGDEGRLPSRGRRGAEVLEGGSWTPVASPRRRFFSISENNLDLGLAIRPVATLRPHRREQSDRTHPCPASAHSSAPPARLPAPS